MVKLALMCKSQNFRLNTVCPGSDEYRTGQWVVGKKKRKELIGEKVILTKTRNDPAYMGGEIISFNPLQNGKVEVLFKDDPSLIGNTDAIGQSGWGLRRSVCYVK
jgi:hypothetical protein